MAEDARAPENVGDRKMQDYGFSDYTGWHFALLAFLIFLWVFPLWRIIGKAGYPPAISLFAIFPALGLVLLWWLAFARWRGRRSEPVM
jgi:hypothetical protein